MTPFAWTGQPGRVVFGAGRVASLADEVARLGATRALVLCTPGRRELGERTAAALGARAAGVFAGAEMHVPVEVAARARAAAAAAGADCCVAVGGGSTIGLGKAIALTESLPVVAVPTTYSGSEMTAIWGMTEAGVKTTGRDPRVLPAVVVYDPELLMPLPAHTAAVSGLNAIAHCAEALYAQDANPVTSMIAEEGLRAIAASLPAAAAPGAGVDARGEVLYGAWLAGLALNGASMAIHHKLCHTLGGSFGLPHAETHAVVLPYAIAYVRDAVPQAMARIRRALGRFDAGDAARGLRALGAAVGAPASLRELGLPADGPDRAAELAVKAPYWNPRPVERDAIRDLLQRAFDGAEP